MKTKLSMLFIAGITYFTGAQTTLFQDDFETGAALWSINTNDLASAYAHNKFVINDVYTPTGSFTLNCSSLTITPSFNPTPAQPESFENANQNYLHITSVLGDANGASHSHYISRTSSCGGSAENHFARMTNPISTVGYTNVTIKFALLTINNGSNYGGLFYSLDNGATWVQKDINFAATTSWTEVEFTDPAWENASSLLFGFNFYTGLGSIISGTNSPALSIDNVKIIGTGSSVSSTEITTNALTTTSFCNAIDNNVNIPFNVSGPIDAANVYNAYLSDENGSFANATLIGSLISSAVGDLSISATIPAGITPGTNYRVRVVATSPSTEGTDNGTNIVITANPEVALSTLAATICEGESTLLEASGATDYAWSPATGLSATTGSTVTATPTATTTYTVTGTTNGCSATETIIITVNEAPSIAVVTTKDTICEGSSTTISASGATDYEWSPATGLNATTGNTVTASPTATTTYTVTGTANGCSATETILITVDDCAGIATNNAASFIIYPNPTQEFLFIQNSTNTTILVITITDLSGRTLQTIDGTANAISTSDLQSGQYMLLIQHDKGTSVQSFVKR